MIPILGALFKDLRRTLITRWREMGGNGLGGQRPGGSAGYASALGSGPGIEPRA